MRKPIGQFLLAALVLGIVAYLLKGRERGLSFWVVLIGAAVFQGINLLARLLSKRHRGE